MTNKKLVKLFKDACAINSPSGEESDMAKWIAQKITKNGWKVWFDNSKNLYAYLEIDPKMETIAFSAHTDTVAKKGDLIHVIFDGVSFKSDGKTILGADNKVGVCSLINLTAFDKNIFKKNILLFFPTHEESGTMGSSCFNFKGSKIKFIFNIDGGGAPGTFVYKSLGHQNFKIWIKGLAAHAAQNYSKGKNAILAAAELVTKLPIGVDSKKGYTFNIGAIHGGEKTNIVCDLVELKGEFRAFDQNLIKSLIEGVKKKTASICTKYGVSCDVQFDTSDYSSPLKGSPNSQIVKVCKKACKNLGLKFKVKKGFFTSDANSYSKLGLQTIVVARGGKNPHSVREEVTIEEIEKACVLVKELATIS